MSAQSAHDDSLVPAPAPAAVPPEVLSLTAPRAPEAGPLVANETGYLIAAGSPTQRLFPRTSRYAFTPISAFQIGYFILRDLFDYRIGIVGELVAIFALCTTLFTVVRKIGPVTLRRRNRAAQAVARVGEAPSGGYLKLVGTVASGPTFTTPFRGVPAVLARSTRRGVDELRGMDFTLITTEGERIAISARDAFFLDPPRVLDREPLFDLGTWNEDGIPHFASPEPPQDDFWSCRKRRLCRETHLAPGDRIEVCGVLDREPAPDGQAGPGRPTPMRPVLRGEPGRPLIIQRAPA